MSEAKVGAGDGEDRAVVDSYGGATDLVPVDGGAVDRVEIDHKGLAVLTKEDGVVATHFGSLEGDIAVGTPAQQGPVVANLVGCRPLDPGPRLLRSRHHRPFTPDAAGSKVGVAPDDDLGRTLQTPSPIGGMRRKRLGEVGSEFLAGPLIRGQVGRMEE